jgi:hypothetical protein
MVVAIFCGHPDNLEDSDESEPGTVAWLDTTKAEGGNYQIIFHLSLTFFIWSFAEIELLMREAFCCIALGQDTSQSLNDE